MRHFRRNRYNPFRVAAPQQTSTCTEEICVHPRYQIAVEYLQQHSEEGIRPTEKKFGISDKSLRGHATKYHPQEVEKRQKECTEEECINLDYQKAVEHLQKHPEEGIRATEKRFGVFLRYHLAAYHPLEIKKRQRKSDCNPNKCLNSDFRVAVEYLQIHLDAGYTIAKRFGLSDSSLRNHVAAYHPLEAKKRRLKSDCTPRRCHHPDYQTAVEYLQNHPEESQDSTADRFELPRRSLHKHVATYHPREAKKRQVKSDCIEKKCINLIYQDAVKYLQKYPKESVQATAGRFELSKHSLQGHIDTYHPLEAKKRQRRSDCKPNKCLNSAYQAAVEYLQGSVEGIKSTERKFGLAKNSLREHVEVYHPQEAEKRRRKPIRRYRNRYNPFRVAAPQQANTCAEEVCLHPIFQVPMHYLQEHADASVRSTEIKFELPQSSLRSHAEVYHPQEIKKRQKKSDCIDECSHPKYRKAMNHAQEHPEDSIKLVEEIFGLPRESLRHHMTTYHKQEAKKRQRGSACTEGKCINLKFRAAVSYLQKNFKADVQPTARSYKLSPGSLRKHLVTYHPQEVTRRQLEFNCTEEECINPKYQDAIKHLQMYPEANLNSIAKGFEIASTSLYNHIEKYHPKAKKLRRKPIRRYNPFRVAAPQQTGICTEEICRHPQYQDAVEYLQQHPTAGIEPTEHDFHCKSLRYHLKLHHSVEIKKRSRERARCTQENCIDPDYRDAVKFLQEHSEAGTKPVERDFHLGKNSLRKHLERYHPQEIEKRRPKRECIPEICVDPNYRVAVGYLQKHPDAEIKPLKQTFKVSITPLRHHLEHYHPQELEKRSHKEKRRRKKSGQML